MTLKPIITLIVIIGFLLFNCTQTSTEEKTVSSYKYEDIEFEMPLVKEPVIPDYSVNITDFKQNLFLNTRTLVILGENSHLRLVQCDDSINHDVTFINSVTEVKIGRNSTLDHYKLQNKDDHTTLINSMYFHQDEGSSLSTNAISLNGGLIRNLSHVTLNGSHSNADISGLYLMDRYQHVDNQVFINHACST